MWNESHQVVLFPEVLKELIRDMVEFNALINVANVLVLVKELLPVRQEQWAFDEISKEVQGLIVGHFNDLFLK